MKPYYDEGGITIYHGDCREVLPVKASALVTDPPYGIAYSSSREGPYRGHQIVGDADTSLRDEVLRLWPPTLPALVFGTWKQQPPKGTKTVLVWDKGLGPGMGDLSLPWRPNWEEIYVLGQGFSGYRGSSILCGAVVTHASKGRLHPNQKPIPLLQELLLKVPHAETVLDPFMGSGTTLRAAKDLGRKAIGIEIEERYCEIAAQRLAQEVLSLEAA